MPTKNSKQLKLPASVHARLQRLADEYQAEYERTGKVTIELQTQRTSEPRVPLHAVITKALDQMESHRQRSRIKKRKR